MSKKRKMNKDIVPDDFTLSLALVDAVPVIFFGLSMVKIGMLFHSYLFITGALLALFAGACKVLWKIIVVLKKKNIWFLFVQMRILMPIGMLMILVSLVINSKMLHMHSMMRAMFSFPACVFFLIFAAGMVMMLIMGFTLDSSDVKSNWLEQCVNGVAQIALFIGLLLV